jgi:hypothetical protein
MRQVQHPTPRAGRPAPGTTVTQLLVRPAVQAWLDRLGSLHRPLAACGQPHPPAEEVNPMAKLRQLITWLVLVTAPTALLLIETAGAKRP